MKRVNAVAVPNAMAPVPKAAEFGVPFAVRLPLEIPTLTDPETKVVPPVYVFAPARM